ncbi:DUF1328 family protein [Geoalkalibacter sp.]|uniref:DUF1328 family protein n=1 Tax=Geoalkalibacter sp. TaxID=3041440 RepID=UPI00272ECF89|nr:DUF1328 family protein [Geoalkalibacter sp.]
MLDFGTLFFTLACIAAVLLFLDISAPVNKVAKILCGIFLILFTLTLFGGFQRS